MDINDNVIVNGKTYHILKLIGHGKGGYSYLVACDNNYYTLKQIHHEPCDYYKFGDKMASELNDYKRLIMADVRIPKLIDYDIEKEIIIKEYIDGPTIAEMVEKTPIPELYIRQIQEIAQNLKNENLNIDYYPTNFVVQNDMLYYIDYECNNYMSEWDFENWGIRYWTANKG